MSTTNDPGAALSSEEIAEIDRTFEFDTDAKSVTIMRLVAEVRRLHVTSDALKEALGDIRAACTQATDALAPHAHTAAGRAAVGEPTPATGDTQ